MGGRLMPRKKAIEKTDVYMPLFCRDFLMSTIGWTAEQRGHYLTLLMVQWDRGGLPAEWEQLGNISGNIQEHAKLLENKFPVHADGLRRNKRLEEHRAKASEIIKKRRENGKKGGRPRGKPNGYPSGTPNGYPDGVPDGVPAGVASKSKSINILSNERIFEPPPRADAEDRKPGHALPAWEELREAWSQAAARCRHIAPFGSLHPPAAFLDRLDELAWQDDWRRGIERLEKCRWFTTPVSLTFFLKPDTLAAILAGQYDPRKPAKPGEPQSHGPVISTRMWRDDACQNMTDEQYVAWRRTVKEVAS